MRGSPSGIRSLGFFGISLSRLGMEVGHLASSTFHLSSGLLHGGTGEVEEEVSSLRLVVEMLDLLVVVFSKVGVPPVVEAEAKGQGEDCRIGTVTSTLYQASGTGGNALG
jgi:hypothetical protein